MTRVLRGRAGSALGVALALSLLSGCIEWLEVSDPDAEVVGPVEPQPVRGPARLPTTTARSDGAGPIVPGTPGLRVPDGYWTRARLDSADLLLTHTWIVVHAGTVAADPVEQPLTLRLLASTGADPTTSEPRAPLFRAVLPLAVPEGTTLEALVGLDLGPEALTRAVASIVLSEGHHWLLEPTRLRIEEVTPELVKGTFEATARHGSRAERTRTLEIGFIALRGPKP